MKIGPQYMEPTKTGPQDVEPIDRSSICGTREEETPDGVYEGVADQRKGQPMIPWDV
jgi:hypothetical protein